MSYERNIEYLKKRSSNVTFDHIVGAAGFDLYDIEVSADGSLSFMAGKDSKVQLHSRRDPEGEARRQVDSWIERDKPELDGLVIVCGFGGMFHIKEIASRLQSGALLLIVEKYPGIIRKALDHCDFSKLVCADGSCIVFIASESGEELRSEYHHYLETRKNLKVSVFLHPGLSRAFSGDYEALVGELKYETEIELMVQNTKAVMGREWLEHSICNLPEIFDSYDLEVLKNRHEGSTAILVAAGPSLDESAAFIPRVRNKCIIFAVGRAYKALLERGIKADYVVHMDTATSILQHFKDISLADAILLSETLVCPELADLFRGRTFFFSTSAVPGFENFLKLGGIFPRYLSSGGTVAISTMDAAIYMGCRRVFFMGLDLSFDTNGSAYAADSPQIYKKTSSPIVKVKGNYTEEVTTAKEFADYIKMIGSYLEGISREGGVDFFNVTSKGAALPYCKLILPSELENEFSSLPEEPAKRPELSDLKTYTETCGKERLLAYLRRGIAELNESASLAAACHSGPDTGLKGKIKALPCAQALLDDALHMLKYTGTPEEEKSLSANHQAACEWLSALLASAETSYRDGNCI